MKWYIVRLESSELPDRLGMLCPGCWGPVHPYRAWIGLSRGSVAEPIAQLQHQLNSFAPLWPSDENRPADNKPAWHRKLEETGEYDAETMIVVSQLQKLGNLMPTGKMDAPTVRYLCTAEPAELLHSIAGIRGHMAIEVSAADAFYLGVMCEGCGRLCESADLRERS